MCLSSLLKDKLRTSEQKSACQRLTLGEPAGEAVGDGGGPRGHQPLPAVTDCGTNAPTVLPRLHRPARKWHKFITRKLSIPTGNVVHTLPLRLSELLERVVMRKALAQAMAEGLFV